MGKSYVIYFEYGIKEDVILEYEIEMKNVLFQLTDFGVELISWYSPTPNRYVEIYHVPTESHYYAMKRLRRSKNNHTFRFIHHMIAGGMDSMQSCALQKVI